MSRKVPASNDPHIVKMINQEVLGRAFAKPAAERYYVREEGGRESIRGLCLRVGVRTVWFGTRCGGSFQRIALASPGMSPVEIDRARRLVRERLREMAEAPLGRPMPALTVRELGQAYLEDLAATRGDRRSGRTLPGYADLWRNHIDPLIGDLPLRDAIPETVRRMKRDIAAGARERRPWARNGGRTVANRALQQLDAAWSFALRMEWVLRNPWSARIVSRYEESPDEFLLTAEDYAALGRALREAEDDLSRPRPPLPMRSLAAVRVLLLTGARPGEVTPAVLSPRHRFAPDGRERHWCDLDAPHPGIRVPRAKGDRAAMKRASGRWIFLPPEAVEAIRTVPRLDGSIHAFPGDRPGEPLSRLDKAWKSLLSRAGLDPVPLKTTRPSWRTHAADAGVSPEHAQLLLGHAGLKVTDTVYLKRISPSLALSAAKAGAHISRLLEGK